LFGASGLTGKLTAAHLIPLCRDRGIKVGLAARSLPALERVLDAIEAAHDIPLILAVADDAESLTAMVKRTKCVLSMVGPYQLYGSELVRICAETGTDYLDVNGEPAWMARMIEAYEQRACASGARILFSCGFDSVPFDLGVYFFQASAIKRTGSPVKHVRSRVRMRGIASDGSVKTNSASNHAISQSASAAALAADPYALVPGGAGVAQPNLSDVRQDLVTGVWLAPFIMAPINSKSVHRTNHLLGDRYGRDFTYDEMFITGSGDAGQMAAERLREQNDLLSYLAEVSKIVPQNDDGTGYYDIEISGEPFAGGRLTAHVRADHDPGYETTARIATQASILLLGRSRGSLPGRIWTPAAAFGETLINHLDQEAGISFAM
jgi:short subunit dehydrogenase-like uncharacterized protein